MFPENRDNHYQLHLARQRELELNARMHRLSSAVTKKNGNALRKRIGMMLISLGRKLSQEAEQDIQMAFASQQ